MFELCYHTCPNLDFSVVGLCSLEYGSYGNGFIWHLMLMAHTYNHELLSSVSQWAQPRDLGFNSSHTNYLFNLLLVEIGLKNQNILDLKNYSLQLPREPHWSTRLLQLAGRWQYDGIMWLALRSVKSNNVDFLNQIRYFSIK